MAKVLNGLQVDQDVFKLSKQKEAGRHAPGLCQKHEYPSVLPLVAYSLL